MNNPEQRRAVVCPEDGTENSPHAPACAQCGRRLSRVAVNGVFVQRYRILKSLGESPSGFRYLAQLAGNGQSLMLREMVPPPPEKPLPERRAPGSRERLLRFDRAARHLASARPGCLLPVLDHFTDGPCFYTIEGAPQGPRLLETIELTGVFPEAQANALLAGLLAGLRELYSLDPPVYVGDLDAGKILINNQKAPVFLEAGYLTDTVMKADAPSAQEIFGQDLYASAYAAVGALAGAVAPDPQRVSDTLSRVKDLPFGCTLDWILHANGKKPESWQTLDQFRSLVVSAESAMKGGNTAKAMEFLGQAHDLSGSKLVEASLQKLEKSKTEKAAEKKAEKGDKPAPPQAAPPVRLTVQPASTAAVQPPTPRAPGIVEEPPSPFPQATGSGATWPCPACRTVSPREAAFCTHCGQAQGGAAPQLPTQLSTHPGNKLQSIAVVLVVLAVVALGVWSWFWFSGSLMRDFDAALKKNQLAAPAGRSAYDFYKKALASDGAGSTVEEMNGKAAPKLHTFSNEQFHSWQENSSLSGADWGELAKAEEWLAAMSPTDATSQARKQFADAQVALQHNHFSEALSGFQNALRQLPNWDLALMGIGRSCFALKRYACAEEYYGKAKQLEPNWIWPHHNLMELYLAPARRNIPAACVEFQSLMDLSGPMSPPPFDRDALRQRMEKTCPATPISGEKPLLEKPSPGIRAEPPGAPPQNVPNPGETGEMPRPGVEAQRRTLQALNGAWQGAYCNHERVRVLLVSAGGQVSAGVQCYFGPVLQNSYQASGKFTEDDQIQLFSANRDYHFAGTFHPNAEIIDAEDNKCPSFRLNRTAP